jgi:hypothetical protein
VATLCRLGAFRPGDCPQRAPKIVDEQVEIGGEDIASSDDDHIRIDIRVIPARRGNGSPESALDPVAFGGVADPLRDREAETQAKTGTRAQSSLDRHPLGMKAAARGRRDEVRSFRQTPEA